MKRIAPKFTMLLVAAALTLPDRAQTVAQTVAQTAANLSTPIERPIVNATTMLLANIDPMRTDLPSWLTTNDTLGQLVAAAAPTQNAINSLKTISPKDKIHVVADIPSSSSQPMVRLMFRKRNATAQLIEQQLRMGSPVGIGDYLMVSPGEQDQRQDSYGLEENVLSSIRPRFAEAAEVVQDFPIQVLVAPPKYLWQTFDELLPELPKKLGGGPTSVLTRGMRWAAIGIDLAELDIVATIQSESNEDAIAFSKRIPALLKIAVAMQTNDAASQKLAEAVLASIVTGVEDDRIQVTFKDLENEAAKKRMLAGLAATLTGPLSRGAKRDQFRTILLAILNYESANGTFPPSAKVRGEDGRSGLSWRVHILPFIGDKQQALWKRFHLNERWDSPHNKTLLKEMPSVYDVRSRFTNSPDMPDGFTTYVAPVGEGTVFGGNEAVKFSEVRDGSSKTLALVEVKTELAVPWTAPQDYKFDLKAPASGLAWDAGDITLGGACDGHIAEIPRSFSDDSFLRAFIMNDGQPVPVP